MSLSQVLPAGRADSLEGLVKLTLIQESEPCCRPLAREGWLTQQKEAEVNQEMMEMAGVELS